MLLRRMRGWSLVVAIIVLAGLAVLAVPEPAAAQGAVICVDGTAAGPGSGACWSDPYQSLATAFGSAQPGDEIWVAGGVYKPGATADDTFAPPAGVAIYGGFAATETLRTQRNWMAHVTVLSGDIGGDDRVDANGVVTATTGIAGTNSWHVVTLNGSSTPITATTRLDGFTITAGSAIDAAATSGGGLYCIAAGGECSPALANIIFSGNQAAFGGGMFAGTAGGASRPALSNVRFSGNAALDSGGALYAMSQSGGDTSPSLLNVTLSANRAEVNGGALYAGGDGGASSLALVNVILWGNSAPNGAALYSHDSAPTINYSVVQGGDSGIGGDSGTDAFSVGVGNSSADPLLASVAGGKFSLLPGSPAIDSGAAAGAPLTDIRGWPRPANGAVDMGAYEAQGFTLTISGGNGQATAPNGAFTLPLKVTFKSRIEPVGPGGVVTFTPPAGGPGLNVTAPFTAGTSTSGIASRAVTANGLWGAYHVTVTARGVVTPVVFSLTNGCPTGVAYVNGAAAGANRGDSWADAYTDLRDALRLAPACGTFSEVWVAAGIYTPGVVPQAAFTVSAGVAVYGGFTGVETERTQRDWAAHVTVLSGDIDNNDIKDANGVVTTTTGIQGKNAYHVVWMDGVTKAITHTTRLDGFVITGGKAYGGLNPYLSGGGLYCNGQGRNKACSPTITNVLFSANAAISNGGAMYNNGRLSGASSPILSNVIFRGNRALSHGGAIFNYSLVGASSPTITLTIFEDNAATGNGGAIYNYGLAGNSSPVLDGVIFRNNSAFATGGAIYNYGYNGKSQPLLRNVLFAGNRARRGGAIYNNGGQAGVSSPTLTNVTLVDNVASENGGAIYSNGISGASQVTLTNTILWQNVGAQGAQLYNVQALATINNSLVQGGDAGIGGNDTNAFSRGAGNLDTDPLFVHPSGGNFNLLPGSPAIDAGTDSGAPVADLRGLPRPRVLQTDMGAYEVQGFDLAITGGDAQTADIGGAFALPLAVAAGSSSGELAGPGGILSFTPPASGPGLSSTVPFTLGADGSGGVAVAVGANNLAGTFNVTVTARGAVAPAVFTLTNQYTITVAADAEPAEGGAASGGGRVAYGSLMTVTAAANAGYVFANWTDGGVVVSAASEYSFVVTGNRLLVAHFSPVGPEVQQVQVSAAPAAGGNVSGGGWFNAGEVVTVTAVANAGYMFAGWTEDGVAVSPDAAYRFNVTGDRFLVAHFSPVGPTQHTVQVSAAPVAGGNVSGGGVFNAGDVVTVTAAANPFYLFVQWTEGETVVSASPSYSFAVSAERALVAHFAPVGPDPRQVTVRAEPAAGGKVSGGGWAGYGAVVTVTAVANTGYVFENWTEAGAEVSVDAVYSFAALADRDLVAHFRAAGPELRQVVVSAEPATGGSVSGPGVVNFGAVVTVTAAANPGYVFEHWTEDGIVVATAAAWRFTVTADRNLVAHFSPAGPDLRQVVVSAEPAEGGAAGGGGWFSAGSVVTVTAAANAGYVFTQWTDGETVVSTSAAYSFVLAEDRLLVAHFSPVGPEPRQVQVSAAPAAGGSVRGGGWFNAGDVVTVTAAANSGYVFEEWTEDGVAVSPNAVYRFSVASDRALVAHFRAAGPGQFMITLHASPSSGGVLSGSGVYASGAPVTVTAAANAGYVFNNWTEGGAVVASAASYSFVAAADRTLAANFIPLGPITHTIALSAEPPAGGAVTGGGAVNYGDVVTVTATANAGYVFAWWAENGAPVATAAAYSFVATADRALVAVFQPLPVAVNDAAGALAGSPIPLAVTANDLDPAGGGLAVTGLGAPAHGEAAVAPDGRTLVYTATAGYAGVDSFAYTVADANGQRDSALVVVVVADGAAGEGAPQVQAVADPAVQSSLVFSTATAALNVQLPGGFFTGTLGNKDVLFLVFIPRQTPSERTNQPPPDLLFGNLEFDLAAFYNDQPLAATQFALPLTVVIAYDGAILGDLKPETLGLWYWNGAAWSTGGITVADRDGVNHTIVLVLSHLSSYAFFAGAPTDLALNDEPGLLQHLYLPIIGR